MTSKYAMSNRKNGRRYLKDEDFDEEEVWSNMVVLEDTTTTISNRKPKISTSSSVSSSNTSWRVPAAASPKLIPKPNNVHTQAAAENMFPQPSAPVNIPVYGRNIGYRSSCHGNSWMVNDDHDDGHGQNSNSIKYGGFGIGYRRDDQYDGGFDSEEEEDEDIVPPHEYLARRLARSQISSFSVCEGIGRTHKGRDLSKFRNAILRKTGFLE